MSTNNITVTLIKLGAIFIVVLAAGDFADYVFYFSESAPKSLLIGGLIFHLFIPLVIAWMLWRFPNLIASSLTTKGTDDSAPQVTNDSAMLVGIALLGLYTLIFGVVDLVYFEAYRYSEEQISRLSGFPETPTSPQSFAGRITNIAQIVFGIGLLLGRERIVELIRKARGAGTGSSQ